MTLSLLTIVAVYALTLLVPIQTHAATVTTSIRISICGDGIIQSGEVCDNGAGLNTGLYGSTTAQRHCTPDCQSYGSYCGDGILQVRFFEQCDDGSLNGTSNDLCSSTCVPIIPVALINPPPTGAPPVGSIPNTPGANPGAIQSSKGTQVVLRGKAYPNSTVSILVDGQKFGTVQADSNADFLYTSGDVTSGTVTFSFSAVDATGVSSLLESVVFQVVQSAITTVSNIFLPPSIALNAVKVSPGDLLTISGQSVPFSRVTTQLDSHASSTLAANVDASGNWALQLDTGSVTLGAHEVKASFLYSTSTQSGFGRSVSFDVGAGSSGCSATPDLNSDKKVNLIDFSIFLTMWQTSLPRSDFNCDGTVNLADFSIMLFNWTG